MPDDCTSSADIVLSGWRYIGPIGDLSMPFKLVGTSSKAKIFVAASAGFDVRPTGTSVSGASPSRAKPSRIATGILSSTAMPRDTALTGRPRSLAMRLKCAAAIWLFTEPWRHTNMNVAGLLEFLMLRTCERGLRRARRPEIRAKGIACKASFLYLALVFLIKVLRRFATYRLRACLIATERTVAPIEEA